MTKNEKELFEKKFIKNCVNTMNGSKNITSRGEKIINAKKIIITTTQIPIPTIKYDIICLGDWCD